MKPAEAIRIATGRVQFISLGKRRGRQYQVNHYSDKHSAWWEGNITHDRQSALREAWEHKVCAALKLLDIEDADALAYFATEKAASAPHMPDWRGVVRRIYRSNDIQPYQVGETA